jgi:hypothetical protein
MSFPSANSLIGKDDCQQLVDAAMPMAEYLLAKNGEFYPFGEKMLGSGEIVRTQVLSESDSSASQDLIDLIRESFRREAEVGALRATAIVSDVLIGATGTDQKSNAISIQMEHLQGYSATVCFPYELEVGKVVLADPFLQQGVGGIFPPSA